MSFQFTRARGARQDSACKHIGDKVFQFTRARGARQHLHVPRHPRHVSIHARTGRATVAAINTSAVFVFQFTRARGARQDSPETPCQMVGFNSRAHGARDSSMHARLSTLSFQFTRARGARLPPAQHAGVGEAVSIHARTGRATGPPPRLPRGACRFNSRAHGARDDRPDAPHLRVHCFNSRAHGARDPVRVGVVRVRVVSIHARTGRATSPAATGGSAQ